MIKAVIFDFDNTLMDFMRMKKAAVETAVDAMIDAGLTYKKADMIEKIYKGYALDGIEDQQIFDKSFSKNSARSTIRSWARASSGTGAARKERWPFTACPDDAHGLARLGLRMGVVSDAPRIPVWLRICGLACSIILTRW